MTLAANMNPRQGTVIHGLHIEGIGTLFVSRGPEAPSGASWAAPYCARHPSHRYTVLPVLDDRAGLAVTSETWNPRKGISEGGSATFRLRATDDVLDLFGYENPDINSTYLASDLGYDVASTGDDRYAVNVGDTSSFSASGYVHLGRECVYYPSATSTAFGAETPAGSNCQRGVWTWQSDSRLDRRHVAEATTQQLPAVVTDHPRAWKGRRVTVLQWWADADGRCLDTAYRGTHEVEVWSGWIDSVEFGATAISLSCKSLVQGLSDREIGRDKVSAYLGGFDRGVYCTSSNMTLRGVIVDWNGNGPTELTGIEVLDYSGDGLRGWQDRGTVARAVAASIARAANVQLAAWSCPQTLSGYGGMLSQVEHADGWTGWQSVVGLEASASVSPSITILAYLGKAGSLIGMDSIGSWSINGSPGASKASPILPYKYTVGEDDTDVDIVLDPLEDRDFPSSGLAKVTWDSVTEILSYTGKETLSASRGTYRLTGCARGLFATGGSRFELAPGVSNLTEETNPRIVALYGWDDEPLSNVLLEILLSTGSGAYSATYDAASADVGLALDPACVDVDAFDAFRSEPFSRKSLAPEKPLKVKDLISSNGVFHGFVFGASVGRDGRYRLRLLPVPLPTLVRPGLSLSEGADGGIVKPDASLRTTLSVVNTVEVSASYDPVSGEQKGDPVSVVYANGRDISPDGETLSVEVVGLASADLYSAASYVSERIFALWGEPQGLLTFSADRRALFVSPGETVSVSLGGLPTPYGSRGFTSQTAVVISTKKNWFSVGDQPAVTFQALVFPEFGGLAPSFSVSVSGTTVTVSDNEFTSPGDTPRWDGYTEARDWMHGPASGESYRLYFYESGDYANGETRTATYSADGTWTLDSSLSITPDLAEFAPWDDSLRHADQDLYVHIADAAETLGSTPDDGFDWSP